MLWEVYTDKVAAGLPQAFDLIFLGEIPVGLMILNNMRRPNTFTNVVAFTGLSREYNSRKPAFLICKNTVADQVYGNRAANQRLCFRYIDSTIPLLPKSEISSLLPSSVALQSCLCRTSNPEDALSHDMAQISLQFMTI